MDVREFHDRPLYCLVNKANYEDIVAMHYWIFVMAIHIHQYVSNSPHIGPVMWKAILNDFSRYNGNGWDDYVHALSQWETTLQCNVVSH